MPSIARLAVFCALLPLASANAQEHNYIVQPGDNPWRIAQFHLKPGLVDDLIAHNKIADPHRIPPGTVLRIPDSWLFRGSRPVGVIGVSGDVRRVSGKGQARSLQVGETIPGNSRIQTPEQGSATLEFADGSRILLGEKSDLHINKSSFVPLAEGRDIRLEVPTGKVENAASPQGERPGRFEIHSPSGVAAVRGTHFRIASDKQASRTEVLEGKVAVRDRRGSQVALAAGYGIATEQGRNGEQATLLTAPSVAEEKLRAERLPIDLPLAPVAGASAYRTQVSPPGELAAPLSNQVSESAVMRIRDIPDGDYQLHVRAIDGQGLEGRETTRPLTINAHPSAPFPMIPGAGAEVSNSQPEFRWSTHAAATSYHFQLAAEATFAMPVADAKALTEAHYQLPVNLAEGKYFWRVATRSASDGQGPFSAVESFTRVPASPGTLDFYRDQQTLRWQTQAAARYHLQIASNAEMTSPVIDKTIDGSEFKLDALAAGQYFARVQTLGSSGLSSQWSDVQSFTVESGFDWRYLLIPLPLLLLL